MASSKCDGLCKGNCYDSEDAICEMIHRLKGAPPRSNTSPLRVIYNDLDLSCGIDCYYHGDLHEPDPTFSKRACDLYTFITGCSPGKMESPEYRNGGDIRRDPVMIEICTLLGPAANGQYGCSKYTKNTCTLKIGIIPLEFESFYSIQFIPGEKRETIVYDYKKYILSLTSLPDAEFHTKVLAVCASL